MIDHLSSSNDTSVLSTADLRSTLEIVGTLTRRKLPERNRTRAERLIDKWQNWLAVHAALAFFVTLALAATFFVVRSTALAQTTFILAIAVQIMGVLMNGLVILGGVASLYELQRDPFKHVMRISCESTFSDHIPLTQLVNTPTLITQLILVQYRLQRDSLEWRTAVLSGGLDKIGIFPALATFAVTAASIAKMANPWLNGLIFLVPAFYILNISAQSVKQEMNRVIALLEAAIALRKEQES
jgi:hypothetical protein